MIVAPSSIFGFPICPGWLPVNCVINPQFRVRELFYDWFWILDGPWHLRSHFAWSAEVHSYFNWVLVLWPSFLYYSVVKNDPTLVFTNRVLASPSTTSALPPNTNGVSGGTNTVLVANLLLWVSHVTPQGDSAKPFQGYLLPWFTSFSIRYSSMDAIRTLPRPWASNNL